MSSKYAVSIVAGEPRSRLWRGRSLTSNARYAMAWPLGAQPVLRDTVAWRLLSACFPCASQPLFSGSARCWRRTHL